MIRPAWKLPAWKLTLSLLLLGSLPLAASAQTTRPTNAENSTDEKTSAGGIEAPDHLYKRVKPSLVAVKYQWEAELGKKEIIGSGLVVKEDGLIMVPLSIMPPFIPDKQMKSFKIIIPSDTEDETEVDANFVGRDERSNVGFVRAKEDPKEPRKWAPVTFKDVHLVVGQPLYGVGLLPKVAGYKAFLSQGIMSAEVRGEMPQVLVEGGALSNVGSPVFDAAGEAVGIVYPQAGQESLLDRNELNGIVNPPHIFVPTRGFMQSLQDPPSIDHPIHIPWTGIMQMTGVTQQLAEFLGLKNQPAAQISEVIPGTPADKAGLVAENIIVKVNGQPLERGDLPEEIPQILNRKLQRMKVGDKVTFTILPEKGQPTKDVTLTLEERPKQSGDADRYYAQDLGFVARDIVFEDTYAHKMKAGSPGVVIDAVKRDGAAATAKLAQEDLVTQLNGKTVTNLAGFKSSYDAFRKDHPHDPVVLVVHRLTTGREETINIEPPQSDAGPTAPGGGEAP